MITNFEEITKELTNAEYKILPILVAILKTTAPDKPIMAFEIINRCNATGQFTLKQPTLRKLINFIRRNSLYPVIGTNAGYYLTYDPEELNKQVISLRERATAINAAANGLEAFNLLYTK